MYPDVKLLVEEKGDFFRAELRLATPQVTPQVVLLLSALDRQQSRRELQDKLGLQDREHFRKEYLQPALQAGVIEMTKPDNPRAANQKYFLTAKGQNIIGGDVRK